MDDRGYLITVAVIVRGETLDPDRVTRVLGIDPTESRAKGDKHGKDGKYTARNGFWVLNLRADVATFGECIEAASRLADELIALLRSCPDDFARQFPDCETFVDIFLTGDDGEPHDSRYSFGLTASQLREFARIGADLQVTVA
jgi:hypothetical protein